MDHLEYSIIRNNAITDEIASEFVSLLKKQKKVINPKTERIKKCKFLCICKCDGITTGIGAIKNKTKADFSHNKANLPDLEPEFSWELGYCYTEPDWQKKGISSSIVKLLLDTIGNENLMASTEIYPNNPMTKILINSAFTMHGKPWMSSIHSGFLALFLRFQEGTPNK
jgi:hypothetical protein